MQPPRQPQRPPHKRDIEECAAEDSPHIGAPEHVAGRYHQRCKSDPLEGEPGPRSPSPAPNLRNAKVQKLLAEARRAIQRFQDAERPQPRRSRNQVRAFTLGVTLAITRLLFLSLQPPASAKVADLLRGISCRSNELGFGQRLPSLKCPLENWWTLPPIPKSSLDMLHLCSRVAV